MHRRLRRGAALALVCGLGLSCGPAPEKASSSAAAASPAPVARAAAVETEDAPTRNHRPSGGRAPVIWIGLDALDWELLDRLAAEGRVPHWRRLVTEGATAHLTSYIPILSPLVWTTLATGVGPDIHRIIDFQEVDPATGQKVPISGFSRAVPAVWNVAAASGLSVGVVGWWATHPAEEVKGFFVSDHANPILFEGLPRNGVAYPPSLSAGVEQILSRDGEVTDHELASYVRMPETEIRRARESGSGLENPVAALSRILGATRAQHRIARELYDKNLPDLMMLYFEGTDAIGHVFGSYAPPRMSIVSEEDFARYSGAVDEYYAMIDRILGQWMRRADEDGATLVVNSDHGFRWGAERPHELSSLKSHPALWHRLDGVLAVRGSRVVSSSERRTASVFDVAPTISALLGLPIDRRTGGKVFGAAFRGLGIPERKDLFGTIAVRRLAPEAVSESASNEYAARLRALGYLSGGEPTKLEAPGGDQPGVTEKGWQNLGIYLRETKKDLAGAEAAFRKVLEIQPAYEAPQFALAKVYLERGDDPAAIEWLLRSCQAGHFDPEGTLLQWYLYYDARGKRSQARQVLEKGVTLYPASEVLSRELGLVHYRARRCTEAWGAVARFEAVSQTPETLNVLALFKACLGRKDDAIALFEKSLAIKADQPAVVRSIEALRKS
jgi:predicted AlkP superfamily phosphohydrolase/phosphomutase